MVNFHQRGFYIRFSAILNNRLVVPAISVRSCSIIRLKFPIVGPPVPFRDPRFAPIFENIKEAYALSAAIAVRFGTGSRKVGKVS